jgi:hypothetical protein
MPVFARQLKRLLLVAICVAWVVPWAMLASGQEDGPEFHEEDIDLVEHSSDVFVGTIDIITSVLGAGPNLVTDYTVLVDDVLKGGLTVPMMVVVRQGSGDPLVPDSRYFLFVRFLPAELRYEIVGSDEGIIPLASDEDRLRLTTYWSDVVAQARCEKSDIFKLDSVIYGRRSWSDEKRYLEREWVGATIATIKFQDTSATGCRDDLLDGVASELPAGTRVQRLDGYDTSFRVAVRKRDGHRYLYEAIRSETATTGADLLGFEGRVASIRFERYPLPECDDVGESVCDLPAYPPIEETATIDQVVSLLAAAPVDPNRTNWRNLPPKRLHLVFTLDDSSTCDVFISLRTGLTPSGIVVPVDELMDELGIT